MTPDSARKPWDLGNPIHFLASGFGSGCISYAPGTWGTLVGLSLYALLPALPIGFYLLLLAGMLGAGVWLCQRCAEDLGVHDHPGIVWDEIAGYFITMTAAPSGWYWLLTGFVLFRIFDILKPWPIRKLDQSVEGGLGIMIDDVLAGAYAWVCLQGGVFFWEVLN